MGIKHCSALWIWRPASRSCHFTRSEAAYFDLSRTNTQFAVSGQSSPYATNCVLVPCQVRSSAWLTHILRTLTAQEDFRGPTLRHCMGDLYQYDSAASDSLKAGGRVIPLATEDLTPAFVGMLYWGGDLRCAFPNAPDFLGPSMS